MINLVKKMNLIFLKKAQLWLGFFILILFIGCKGQNQTITINGITMGTTYSIKIIDNLPQHIDINSVKTKIDSVLQVVNQQMSTYILDSEISRFNRLISKDWFPISNEFYDVIVMAQEISRLTNGAFDITVGPIIDLWGFGRELNQSNWQPPTEQEIEETIKSIGFNNIVVGKNSIKKVNPDIKIDLNAIAKGYGVDAVFGLLSNLGHTDVLVEIGGEVRCSGYNNEGEYWKIGIDKPMLDIQPGIELQAVISLDNKALATSGDYRTYFKYNGKLFSHIIDPVTGYPAQNNVASVSVIAPNCMTADALATALMVMRKEGIELINSLDDVEAMIIIRTDENEFNSVESFGWVKS
ncbi:MAG: FAD:protein FMN transferase [Candidatus Marinimicrobia bacterium]|nr:FAD:protein FMN transferase [Candidatus Neomarinimicrobiota bacterium]